MHKKSRLTAVFLAVILGPLGLLYASPVAAAILIILTLGSAATPMLWVFWWVLSVALADHCVYKGNQRVDEFVKAIRG